MHKVALVDDHTLIAKSLAGIIERFGDFEVLYDVPHGKALQDRMALPGSLPDLVLLDVNMPVMDGFETAAWLKKYHPEVGVLALSVQEEEETLIKMLRSGAQGYLLKNIRPKELKNALLSMIEKGYYYPEWVTHSMVKALTVEMADDKPTVTEREAVFLHYAATDWTYKEIADKMCCSPRTIETYRENLCERFGVKSRVSLVVFALKHQLISLTDY